MQTNLATCEYNIQHGKVTKPNQKLNTNKSKPDIDRHALGLAPKNELIDLVPLLACCNFFATIDSRFFCKSDFISSKTTNI